MNHHSFGHSVERDQWYVFEVKGRYLGKCFTSEREVRKAMPHVSIEGNLVRVLAKPRRVTRGA